MTGKPSSVCDDEDSDKHKVDAVVDYLGVSNENYREQAKNRKENAEVHARVSEASASLNCKIILIGDSAGGNLVLALARWIRDEGVLPPPDGLLLLSPSCDPCEYYYRRLVPTCG